MKINHNTFLFCEKIVLVPYEAHHVPKYHKWMQSAELQELTASEPLSLTEEYNMQVKWRQDDDRDMAPRYDDKCTFIILDARKYSNNEQVQQTEKEIESMVGDVNLFLYDQDDRTTAEVEIMVADQTARGHGLGKAALLSMIRYGKEVLGLTKITAKIGYSNSPSLAMFKKLGFQEISRSDVFEEVTLEVVLGSEFTELLHSGTPGYRTELRPS